MSEAYAEEFQIQKRGRGARGGRPYRDGRPASRSSAVARRAFSNASRPITVEEMEACRKAGIKYMDSAGGRSTR
jgi:hypothetical protein